MKFLKCEVCGKEDETVSVRECGYAMDVNNDPNVMETICDACEHEHLMDIWTNMTHKHIDGYDVFSHFSKKNEWGNAQPYTLGENIRDGIGFVLIMAAWFTLIYVALG